MKNQINSKGMLLAIAFMSYLSYPARAQQSEACQKIVSEIYDGINKEKGAQLVKYLADNFSMVGEKGEIAKLIFPEYIAKLNDKVSDVKMLKESKTNGLTLVYEAKFAQEGINKATFVFDKNNKLTAMDLMPVPVETRRDKSN